MKVSQAQGPSHSTEAAGALELCVCGGIFRVLTFLRVTCALTGNWPQSFLEDQGGPLGQNQGL